MGTIRILPPETARRIAAGEVIDRPASALRELLDNAIDADAHEVSASIEGGGIDSITVVDDGNGMDREDLALAIREHATSKIFTADDLLKTRTLGFRGEALASIAAVARLEIVSRRHGSEDGHRLVAEPMKDPILQPAPAREGTRVTIKGIFESFPARRQFLKRPQSEAMLCRSVFMERALAHPQLAFRWQSGMASPEVLMPASYEERIATIFPDLPRQALFRCNAGDAGFSAIIIAANPSLHRRDRKYLQIFINRRRVPEWGISSVLEYAFGKYLPGGLYPAVFAFLEVDPAFADFNIHPAKKEVRLKRPDAIRSAIHAALEKELALRFGKPGTVGLEASPLHANPAPNPFLAAQEREHAAWWIADADPHRLRQPVAYDRANPSDSSIRQRHGMYGFENISVSASRGGSLPADFWETLRSDERPRYIGRGIGPFLIFTLGDAIWIMDQHAAHERILYDRLLSRPGTAQPLLVPYVVHEDEIVQTLSQSREDLAALGYILDFHEDTVSIEGVPALCAETALDALLFWASESGRGTPVDHLIATLACRAAVKDGDQLDDMHAKELIAEALALPEPRCPHGRPVFLQLSHEYLYQQFGRLLT
ncbi:MAG: DNA mismatch repair endonuclease MutL [Spirochaetaceae bacterium]|nr:DNA mismatch repair endonuclease MutL [Spirochaetaceae bacterium]